jgi:hypothetical protein
MKLGKVAGRNDISGEGDISGQSVFRCALIRVDSWSVFVAIKKDLVTLGLC